MERESETVSSLLTPAPLLLEATHVRLLQGWARSGYPDEVCGLLLGRFQDGQAEVIEVRSACNLVTDRARDRYLLDPAEFLRADQNAREAGLEILGFWHTHPDHPARPSETDRAQAWDGYVYLILSVCERGVEEMRGWALVDDEFVEGVVETWQTS